MILDYFRLAVKSLFRRKLRSWLTMIGIFIGIATVVSLIGLGQGLKDAVTAQIASLGSDKIIVQARSAGFGPPGSFVAKKITDDDVKVIRSVQGVERVASRLLKPVSIMFNKKKEVDFVASMPDDVEGRALVTESLNLKPQEGRLLKAGDKYKILAGPHFAEETEFGHFGTAIHTGDKLLVNDVSFEVVGVFEKTGKPQIDTAMLLPESALRDITDTKEEVSIIVVQATQDTELAIVSDNIMKALRKHRDVKEGKEDFQVSTPQQLAQNVNNILTIVQSVLLGIAAISLLVGGIGIMNTMYTSVLERKKEIGLFKAVGARNSAILSLFLFEAGLLGFVGGACGVLLGVGFAKAVQEIATISLGTELIQASFHPLLLFGALFFSFLIGMISGALPAMQAAKLPPVEALRKE